MAVSGKEKDMMKRNLTTSYRIIFVGVFVLFMAASVTAQDPYPDVPTAFYRVGMLKWNDTPDNDAPDGYMKRTGNRQEFNLFPELEGAQFFARIRYRGNDNTIYELTKENLNKTVEGREFLERVQRSINQNRGEIDRLLQQGKTEEARKLKAQINELAIYLTSRESFQETVVANARVVERVNTSAYQLYNEDIIDFGDPYAESRPK